MGKEAKNGFFFYCWPNMALTNPWIRPNIWSHFERENRREKKRKRKKKKRRREGEKFKQSKRYGTNLDIDHMEFVWHSRKV